MRDAFTSRKRV